MKIWNICLYLAILCLCISMFVSLAPYIFPEHAESITSALPNVGYLANNINDFTNATGAVVNSNSVASALTALGETVASGFTCLVSLITAVITCVPELFAFLGLPTAVSVVIGVLTSILYLLLAVALVQLITGRYFINVE